MRVINRYMNEYSVDFELQSRVRKYLEYTLKNEKNTSEEHLILNKLNKSLKKELLMNSIGKTLKEIPFFAENISENSLEKIVLSMRKIQMCPEEHLFNVLLKCFFYLLFKLKEGNFDENSLFILAKGSLEEVRLIKSAGTIQSLREIKVKV